MEVLQLLTGLLLIDLQNDYFPGGKCELHEAVAAAVQAEKVLRFFRSRKLPIFHVQHVNADETAAFFAPNTPGAEIYHSLAPLAGELVCVKRAPDSFYQTALRSQLDERGVDHLVVCGMMTHMCVDTTVRAAKNFGYGVTLVEDACATKALLWRGAVLPAPTVQAAFLAACSGKFAEVVTADAWLRRTKAHSL